MAGNYGKFIDRSPIICPAGKPLGDPGADNTVSSTLKEYTLEDKITAIKHDAHIWKENEFKPPLELPPIQNPQFRGTETQIKPFMNPNVKTRYQTMIDDLKETPYDSYWNKQTGKTRDQVPGLPAGMQPTKVTFGAPSIRGISMKELVSPPKTAYQVQWESQVGHEMYRKTHNDYNPSEKIERGYKSPPFNKDSTHGIRTKYDPRGIWVKCACNWHITEPVVHASAIQADYLERVKPKLGRVLAPNNNIECVPKNHTFGDPTRRALYGVEELMKDPGCEPCIFKRDFYRWMSSLNKIRLEMKKRTNKDFNFDDFYKKTLYWDKDKSGLLPISTFYELCSCEHITFKKDDIESLLKLLNIINGDNIYYKQFIDLLNMNIYSPSIILKPVKDIPKQHLQYTTTNQAASCDYLIIDNSDIPPAGVPSIRTDLIHGEDTSVNALINPSIYTAYGLSPTDLFMPRSPKTIRKLFEKIGYTLSDKTFEKLWSEGLERDKTGYVCVDTFKSIVNAHFVTHKLLVDETDC